MRGKERTETSDKTATKGRTEEEEEEEEPKEQSFEFRDNISLLLYLNDKRIVFSLFSFSALPPPFPMGVIGGGLREKKKKRDRKNCVTSGGDAKAGPNSLSLSLSLYFLSVSYFCLTCP